VKTVVTESQNGTDEQLVSEEDASKAPDSAMLTEGGMPSAPATKALTPDDPADLKSLPAERKAQLNKQMLTFLKNIEHKYGRKTDIYYTSCITTPEVCTANGLTNGYLTMTTSGGARLQLGLKYAGRKWKMYTISLKKPASVGAN
jgi:hypothetical protein